MNVKILDVFLLPDKYLYCYDCNILILKMKDKKQCPLCNTRILSNSENDIIGYVEDIINSNKDYNDEITVY